MPSSLDISFPIASSLRLIKKSLSSCPANGRALVDVLGICPEKSIASCGNFLENVECF